MGCSIDIWINRNSSNGKAARARICRGLIRDSSEFPNPLAPLFIINSHLFIALVPVDKWIESMAWTCVLFDQQQIIEHGIFHGIDACDRRKIPINTGHWRAIDNRVGLNEVTVILMTLPHLRVISACFQRESSSLRRRKPVLPQASRLSPFGLHFVHLKSHLAIKGERLIV